MGEGARAAEGSGINSGQHGSSRRRRRRFSNMASGARGHHAAQASPAAGLGLEPRAAPAIPAEFRARGKRRQWRRPGTHALAPRTFLLGMAAAGGTSALNAGLQRFGARVRPGVVLAASSHCSGSGGFIKFL